MMSFSVAMITTTDFGVSMIVAPAYIVSQKLDFLTFGQSEYIVQGLLFAVFCVLMKRVKITYFVSFITGLIYGAMLDLWMMLIPHFNPNVFAPGTLDMPLRIVYFIVGMCMTSLAVALFFRTYLYPQIYDLFVKGVSQKYKLNNIRFKQIYDASFLLASVVLSFALFQGFVGINFGTLVMTVCNGPLIGGFGKIIDRFFEIPQLFPKFASKFEL